MDFFLFVLLLVGFAALYVSLQIYFLYTLVILVTICMFYIALRFPRGKDDWPWGFVDNLYLAGMTNVIILVFTIVMPKFDLVGSQLTYPAPAAPEGWELVYNMRDPYILLLIFLVLSMMWLFVFSILIPYLQKQIAGASQGGGMGGAEGGDKPKIGVGA